MPPIPQPPPVSIHHGHSIRLVPNTHFPLGHHTLKPHDPLELISHPLRRPDTRLVQRVRLPLDAAESQAAGRQWVQAVLEQQAVGVRADESFLELREDDDLF